ncbi:AAEL008332-PA [Aedes aegypti]|uniref:AAEL008332-PA n=1 Tax=Aedes aegypti TaxID=7159 RepID=Q16Z29_AEDAE|nr:AAEL008332-PA [Aedes aegypti]
MSFLSATTIAILLLVPTPTPLAQNAEMDIGWLNNGTIQSLIGRIFDQIHHIDIVIGEQLSVTRLGDQIDGLIHRREGPLFGRSVRIYGGEVLRSDDYQEGCSGDRSILSAVIVNPAESGDLDALGVIDRDYAEESSFIGWDGSYESFAKIWDQNHRNGYIVFANRDSFDSMMKCLLDPRGTYLIWDASYLARTRGYPKDTRERFKGYPLRVDIFRSTYSEPVLNASGAIIDFEGADMEVSRVFTEVMNFTADYLPPDKDNFGVQLPNGSFNGVIGRLSRHESDVAYVGFFIKDYFSRDIEFTNGIYTDELCCVVKKASRVPEYLLPITIFPADLWILLFMMGIACSIAWMVLRAGIQAKGTSRIRWVQKRRFAYLFNLSNEIRDAPLYRKLIQICIDTYVLLLSAPYQRFTRSGIERLMLFGIMMVSLIFVSMFQSSLSSVYLNPVYYKDIDSLQRLDEAGIKIPVKYKGYMDDVFPANYSPTMDSLRNKMVLESGKESMLAKVARVGTISTVTRKTTFSLDNAVYITTKQLFMIPECPRSYNLAYVVPRHSVFLEKINIVLSWMLNGGLIDHWINVMNFNVSIKDWDKIRNAEAANFKILTLIVVRGEGSKFF